MISISRYAANQPLKILVEIRADVWLPTGIQLTTSDRSSVMTAAFKWCTAARCLADVDLSDADISKLRAQHAPGQLTYKTSSQSEVSIAVSFNGFGEAMDALNNR